MECPAAVGRGDAFSLEIAYSGVPAARSGRRRGVSGLAAGRSSTSTRSDEPVGAATWFPANDHPADKADVCRSASPCPSRTWRWPTGCWSTTEDLGDEQTFVWEMRQPCASYLAAMAIGEFSEMRSRPRPTACLSATTSPPSLAGRRRGRLFARTGEMLAFFAELFGPYPFEEYGVVVPDAETGTAMENQTMSLFGRDMLREGPG